MSSNLRKYLDNLADDNVSIPSTVASSRVNSRPGSGRNSTRSSPKKRASPKNGTALVPAQSVKPANLLERRSSRMSVFTEPEVLEPAKNYIPTDNYDDYGMTQLMLACRDDDEIEVVNLLERGADVNAIDSDGRTALFHAVTSSSSSIVNILLEANADPFIVAGEHERNCLHQSCKRSKNPLEIVEILLNTMGDESKLEQDKAGLIALHLAVTSGREDICKELLSSNKEAQLHAVTRDYGDTALHLATRNKEYDIVNLLHQSEANINQINIEGQTALHIAAGNSDLETVEFLIGENASGNIKDKRNRTPLHIATEIGNMDIIELLIEKCHVDVNQRSRDGSTLVHLAAKCGHPEAVMFFVERGVAIKTPNKDGAEALHEACKQGHVAVVRALIEKGASLEKQSKAYYTPLHMAVRYGKADVIRVLIGYGCDVNAHGGSKNDTSLHFACRLSRYSEKVMELLLRSGGSVNLTNSDGDTALHVAVKENKYNIVKMLIEDGADVCMLNDAGETAIHLSIKSMAVAVLLALIDEMKGTMSKAAFTKQINAVNKKGETALHYCANIPPKIEHQRTYTDLSKLLIDNHAQFDVAEDKLNETPIHYCCRTGNADVIRMMFAAMPPKDAARAANLSNSNGWPALLIACDNGFASVTRILLDNEARVDLFDENGKAALHVACAKGHTMCAELLLDRNAYVDAKTKLGMNSVSLAAASGHSQLIEILVKKYNASYDIQALNKRAALHMASEKGHLVACKTLLALGSDPMLVDMNQAAPIHLAAENDHPDIVKMFLELKAELVTFINKEGNNCAHIAASKGSLEVMKALINVESTMASAKSKTAQCMPLHLAAAGGHTELLQLLIDRGVPLLDEDKEGNTALHLAAKHGAKASIDMLKGRIPFNAINSKTGYTPLHIAAESNQTTCLTDLLVKIPANVLTECPEGKVPEETEYGYSCLHLAAKNGHEATVRMLLNSDGVVVDQATTKKGLLAIHMAISEGHASVTSLVLSRSAEQISSKCAQGRTALHFAAANNHLKLVQLLLGQGAEINEPDKNGWTPLHYAADSGCIEIVIYLVQMGAAATLEDAEGKAPLTFAAKNHHLEVMSFLLLNKFDVIDLLRDRKFLAHLMICCKLNNNESAQDFILNSPAPIYTAIKLTLMYREESLRIKDKSQDYLEIAEFCEHMTHEILHVATTYGCESLLNAIDDAKQPLLDIMIDNEFKDCIAHSNVQSYLSDLWRGNGIPIQGTFSILVAATCFLCPPIWFFLCLPFHRWNKIPTLKFICHIVSHLYFIIVLSLVIVVPWDRSYLEVYPTYMEWILLVWGIGHLMGEITEPDSQPIRVAVLMMMAASLGTHVFAIFMEGETRLEIMYARDNILGLLLITLMSQIMQFLSLNQMFGPWSIIIASLVFDVFKFLCIMFLFIFTFTLHFAIIFKPVYGRQMADVPSALLSFNGRYADGGMLTMFHEMFFALFGFTNPPKSLTDEERETNPEATYVLATVSFAMYQVLATIILINMLIAMMSNTYTILDERSDVEWKYGRAGIIRHMIKSYSMPVPANLCAGLVSILWVSIMHKCCCCVVSCAHLKEQQQDDSVNSTSSEASEESYDPDDKTAPVPILHVVPWPQIVSEYMLTNGIEDRYAKVKTAAQLYPAPWEWMLLIWLCAMFITVATEVEFNVLRVSICVISALAIGLNILAYFLTDRARENLLYARDNVLAFILLILFIQIFDFMAMHEVFGPWTVMIANLVIDVLKFLVVLMLFIVAFTLHMCVVYKPVYNKARIHIPTDVLPLNNKKSSIIDIFSDMFFACFGMTSLPAPLTALERNDSPEETYTIATFIFALYEIVAVIVLINLLIAMMGNTFARLDERSTIEWRYGRGKVIWAMTKTQTVPIPVNMVSTFVIVVKVALTTYFCCCRANVADLYKNMSFKELVGSGEEEEETEKAKKEAESQIENVVPWRKVIEDLEVMLDYHPRKLPDYYAMVKK